MKKPALQAGFFTGEQVRSARTNIRFGLRISLPIRLNCVGAALKGRPVAEISDGSGVQYEQTPGVAIGEALSSSDALLRSETH